MNFLTTADAVISLPFTSKEKQHTSRQRYGYHVYLSFYYTSFKKLNSNEQQAVGRDMSLGENLRVVVNNEGDDDVSCDSTDTPIQILPPEIMRYIARKWKASSVEIKDSWKLRAHHLNQQPRIDGTFDKIPTSLLSPTHLEDHLLESLTRDWQMLVSIFRNAITRTTRTKCISEKEYVFGREKIILQNQFYRSFYLTHILKITLFGSPPLSVLLPHEIAHRTKNQIIIHLSSYRRANDLLTCGGLEACTFTKKNGLRDIACGKVALVDGLGREVTGYVLDEQGINLRIRFEGSTVILPRPCYNSQLGNYIYLNPSLDQVATNYTIMQFWPIRMKLNTTSGKSAFILNRVS